MRKKRASKFHLSKRFLCSANTAFEIWTFYSIDSSGIQRRCSRLEHSGLKLYEIDAFNSKIEIAFPWASEWVSERANEWAQRSARAKQMSERCERTSKRRSKWPSTQCVGFKYFLPTVRRGPNAWRAETEWNWRIRLVDILLCPMSSGTSKRVSEWAQRSAWAKRSVQADKQVDEQIAKWYRFHIIFYLVCNALAECRCFYVSMFHATRKRCDLGIKR